MMSFPDLSRFPLVGIDVEATGLHWWEHQVFGVSITTEAFSRYWDVRKEPRVLEWLRDQAPRLKRWTAHNCKYEAHMTRECGIDLPLDRAEDTMIAAALLDEHKLSYDLDTVAFDEIGERKEEIWHELANLFGGRPTRDAQIGNLPYAPLHIVERYATQDSRLAYLVWQSQQKRLKAEELERVYNVERDLLAVLVDIEHRGVPVNIARAEQAVDELTVEINRQQQELDELAGFHVNVNPSKSIHTLFAPKWDGTRWVAIDGTPLKQTPAGKPSFDAETLRAMRHPAAAMILQTRQLVKTRDTFLLGHVLGHHHNGIIHANFNQTKSENDRGTGTGRLSCNDPALQQIHKRNKVIAAIVRACFIPDEGHDWTCHDWRQMDFRVFAHYINNPKMLEAYAADPLLDYHKMVADMTGLPRSMTPGVKGNAKQINLGLVFGMGSGKLAQEMGLPYTVEYDERRGREWLRPGPEAEAVFAKYHENVPGVAGFLKGASDIAKNRGYVKTILGRRIRFPGGHFTHKAGGLVFQGTAADALKQKLIEVHRHLKGTNGRLLLNVHDEFDTSLPKGDEGERMRREITEIIECFDGERCPIKFRVPIRADVGIGPDWHEASKD